MRSRVSLFTALLAVGLFAVPHFAQASIPFFGPVIPEGVLTSVCPAGWGMLIEVINRIIELLITLVIVFVAPLMIAYSGFLMVVNQGNAGKLEEAKKILMNTVIGIVVALSGWMIVDALMAVLYNPGNAGGAWWTLVSSQGQASCLTQAGALPSAGLNQVAPSTGVSVVPTVVPAQNNGGTLSGYSLKDDAPNETNSISGPLSSALVCMSSGSGGLGAAGVTPIISSISDSLIASGQKTFAQCATQGGCAHTTNSCHYGGKGSCNGASYAIDISVASQAYYSQITAAAQKCNATVLYEATPAHLHISVGAQSGCQCDVGLQQGASI